MRPLQLFLLSFLFPVITHAQGIITTIAGTGVQGYSADSTLATNAELNIYAGKTAIDKNGTVYLADKSRIRKIDKATGLLITVCGNNTLAYSGDGGPAIDATLADCLYIAFNSAGDLFIADGGNRIRKIDMTTGIITTIAGTGSNGYNGDTIPALSANLATGYIAFDKYDNLYLSEYNRIRKIDANGILTTVGGNGTAGISGDGGPAMDATIEPGALCVDTAGNIYFIQIYSPDDATFVRKIDGATGIISLFAGANWGMFAGDGGPAVTASMTMCSDIAADKQGNVYIVDSWENARIRKVDAAGIINTVAGTGQYTYNGDSISALAANLKPVMVSVDSCGNLYITENMQPRIRKVTYDGDCYTEPTSVRRAVDESGVVSVWPNPASSTVTISSSEKISSVIMVDVTGRIVLERIVNSEECTVDVSVLSSGVYFVAVRQEKGDVSVVKLVRE